VIKHSPRCGAS